MNRYHFLILLLEKNIIIAFNSNKQCIGGGDVLQIYFDFIFGIAYCGVHLFLNGFLKSPEKLIAEKYNYRNQISIQLDMLLFDIRYNKRQRHLTIV